MVFEPKDFAGSELHTYREFCQDPDAIIDRVEETGRSIVITRFGRLLFAVEPFDSEAWEKEQLAALEGQCDDFPKTD